MAGSHPPLGFALLERVEGRLGRLEIWTLEEPAVFGVLASGCVTLGLLRADLARAEEFGRAHPAGWRYVVDVSRVRAADPRNPLLLRRIPSLPHLRSYVVVAPRWWTRLLVHSGRPFVRPDAVVGSWREALEAS